MIGAILAGGRATRLGGGDKALRTVGGRAILARVIEVLREHCDPIVLNANGDLSRFEDVGLAVVADSLPGFTGPLAGVLAAMDWAEAHAPAAAEIVTAPADTPFLPRDLVARLAAEHRAAGSSVTCARSDGIRHPVAALWSLALRDDLRHALAVQGLCRMGDYLDRHAVAYADWPREPIDPFFNVNTPADLEAANRLAAEADRHL